MLTDRYDAIRQRIDAACRRCGRNPSEVTLIAVSKTKPLEMIRELMSYGVRDFGENYPREFAAKQSELAALQAAAETHTDGCPALQAAAETPPVVPYWHFIGHLQTNKVKLVAGKAELIHSVSSLHLLKALQKEAERQEIRIPVLLEVNIAGESTKLGVSREETLELARAAAELNGIRVRGLMAIAPPVEDPEENRMYFRGMRQLMEEINSIGILPEPLTELSMGMTDDFEIAVEEGATYVRVGTAIFGQRDYGTLSSANGNKATC